MAKNRKTPNMNFPVWFDGQNINEALFCEEFLHERRIIFANGAFFTPDGRVTDDLPLRGEIYDKLKFCAVNNIPRKITNILEVLKLEAQVPDFPPEQDRIHVFNGNIRNFFAFYNEICDELKQDEELKNMLASQITGTCYPDPELKTLTIDVGFFISRYLNKDESAPTSDEWWPTDYTPALSVDDWEVLLNDGMREVIVWFRKSVV